MTPDCPDGPQMPSLVSLLERETHRKRSREGRLTSDADVSRGRPAAPEAGKGGNICPLSLQREPGLGTP